MNILFCVEYYFPSAGGMQEVVKRLAEGLVSKGNSITVATKKINDRNFNSLNGVSIKEFNVDGRLATGLKGDIESYREYLLNSQFDLIVLFAAQQWAVDIPLQILDKLKSKKIFVPTGFSGLFDPDFKSYYAQMPNWLAKMDGNVFLSGVYRDFKFSKQYLKDYRLIPNGASKLEFEQYEKQTFRIKNNISQNTRILLHVGSHTGCKGHDETIQVFKRLKSKNLLLLIVGNYFHEIDAPKKLSLKDKIKKLIKGHSHCPVSCKYEYEAYNKKMALKSKNKRILITELNRQEIIEAYHDSQVFIFLSNIECSPIVMYEAMAAGCPIISSDVGNSVEIIEKSGAGLIVPTTKDYYGFSHSKVKESARILDWLLENEEERMNFGKQGNSYWLQNATWEKIVLDYESYFKEVIHA